MQNSMISTRITSLHGSQTSPVVSCMQNNVIRFRNTSFYGPQPSSVVYACKTATLGPELQVSMGPRPHLFFFIQNSDFSIGITSLYGSHTAPVVLCMKNGVISTRKTSLQGSQTSPVVLCMQNSVISPRTTSLHVSQTSLLFRECKTMWLGSELLVSMGPSPHLWFSHGKQRLLDQIYISLRVPVFAC